MPVGTLHDLTLSSRLLRGNPLGNSTRRRLLVYTPPGFSRRQNLRGIIFLPGFGSGPKKWKERDFPMHRLLELMILSGEAPPCVLACVDGSTRLGGSQYLDSPLNGPFMSHIVEEIVPFLRHRFGLRKELAVAGHSSGGFGALHLASRHPEIFPRIASFAGDMHFELTHLHMLSGLVNDLRSGSLEKNLRAFLKTGRHHYMLALCAAYSPNLRNRTWRCDSPIDFRTGEIHLKVWRRWLQVDPVAWIQERASSLRRLEVLYLSCGDRDPYHLHIGADLFTHRCRSLGIRVVSARHGGDHRLLVRQLEAGLKALLL